MERIAQQVRNQHTCLNFFVASGKLNIAKYQQETLNRDNCCLLLLFYFFFFSPPYRPAGFSSALSTMSTNSTALDISETEKKKILEEESQRLQQLKVSSPFILCCRHFSFYNITKKNSIKYDRWWWCGFFSVFWNTTCLTFLLLYYSLFTMLGGIGKICIFTVQNTVVINLIWNSLLTWLNVS